MYAQTHEKCTHSSLKKLCLQSITASQDLYPREKIRPKLTPDLFDQIYYVCDECNIESSRWYPYGCHIEYIDKCTYTYNCEECESDSEGNGPPDGCRCYDKHLYETFCSVCDEYGSMTSCKCGREYCYNCIVNII